jgi:uncharacterized protein with von Willebrand factor type A (vWA) domain
MTNNILNYVSAITGILCSVAVIVATVVGLVPTFRHKTIRATVKAIDRHRAAMKAERVSITNPEPNDDWFESETR